MKQDPLMLKATRITEFIEKETRDLNDEDYVVVLEEVYCYIDASLDTKKEEMDK